MAASCQTTRHRATGNTAHATAAFITQAVVRQRLPYECSDEGRMNEQLGHASPSPLSSSQVQARLARMASWLAAPSSLGRATARARSASAVLGASPERADG